MPTAPVLRRGPGDGQWSRGLESLQDEVWRFFLRSGFLPQAMSQVHGPLVSSGHQDGAAMCKGDVAVRHGLNRSFSFAHEAFCREIFSSCLGFAVVE